MNRTDNSTRKVFQRMNKAGSSAVDIAKAIGRTRQTVYNLRKLDGEKLLTEPNKNTRKPTFDVIALKSHIANSPFQFYHETGSVFGKGKSTIQRWSVKLGFSRKKARTTYREADQDLKKTSN
jgi:predicted transcriptional regulator